LLFPNSQPNDGGGIDGSDGTHVENVVEQPERSAAAMAVSASERSDVMA
jgi:hypothetical protein